MSSSMHDDNKGKDILILCKSPTQEKKLNIELIFQSQIEIFV